MHRTTAEQVQVDVKDGLPSLAVRVEHRPVPAVRYASFLGNRGGAPDELSDQAVVFCAKLVQRFDMTLRDDEHMRRRLWIDIVEGQHAFVLVDDACRNRALDDFAEQAIGHGG